MSSTTLKVIALIAMFFDHIRLFFINTPYAYHWLGRISAPIYLYCCVLSYCNTSNKKKLFSRLYILSIFMELWKVAIGISFMKINFIRTLLITLIIIYVIDSFQRKHKHSKYLLSAFLFYQLFTSIIIQYLSSVMGAENNALYLISSILINALNLDGGIVFVVIGVFMYIFRNNKKKLALSFVFITIIYFILFNTQLIVMLDSSLIHFKVLYDIFSFLTNNIIGVTPNIVTSDIIYGNPQWMMLFSLPFILKYNGKKGYGLKLLFYIFYPLHIILLCILSIISR